MCLVSLMLCVAGPVCAQAINLTETDSGKAIEMKFGDRITIILAGNPTTGYIWETASNISPVLKQSKRPEFKPQSRLIGAGGEYTFCYQAAARGTRELKLVYHRSWEKKAPARTFRLKVTVK